VLYEQRGSSENRPAQALAVDRLPGRRVGVRVSEPQASGAVGGEVGPIGTG